jgi:DNA-binding SARP family transcriptional activator
MLQIALLGRYDIHLNQKPLELGLQPVRLLLAYLLLNRAKKPGAAGWDTVARLHR